MVRSNEVTVTVSGGSSNEAMAVDDGLQFGQEQEPARAEPVAFGGDFSA
jgi:hypothetical protein